MNKLIFALIMALSWNANALIELRAGYGIQTPAESSYQGWDVATMSGFNLDAIFEIPVTSFGVGLRYESMGFDLEAGGAARSTDFTRTALLVNYRLIDTLAYFGFIGSLGFINNLETEISGAADREYDADLTTSIGVEAGVSLGLLTVGGELGYLNAKMKDSNGSNNPDFDASGVYIKALVGVGF